MATVFRRYIKGVDAAVATTPESRNRVVDGWRVIALFFVVFGHWISASIWVQGDGTVKALNTLEWIPGADHLTWIFQVMPIFFIVGGFANAAALSQKPGDVRTWITLRARRLYTPVVPLVLVWVVIVLVLRGSVDDNVLYTGTLSATIPLWFIAVYLTIVAISPITYRWWRHSGPWSAAILAAAAIVIDIARFGLDIEAIGWINFVFVWAFLHQLGYWWYDRDREGLVAKPLVGIGMIVAGLAALWIATSLGWYPTAMVTIPGGGTTNMIPATFANGLLGFAQAGLMLATLSVAESLVRRRRVWKTVVAVSASMMTIYLWHLTALSLVGAVGIFAFNGRLFSFEPGTATWWWMRIPFFAILVFATVLLVAVFGRFERNINQHAAPANRVLWLVGLTLAIGATALMAFVGIVTRDATLNWYIPAISLVAAGLIGAFPVRQPPPQQEAGQ